MSTKGFFASRTWTRLAVRTSVRGAALALRVPVLRQFFLDVLLRRLHETYGYGESDDQKVDYIRWYGGRLKPFLRRLIDERPTAAQALIRFLGTWIDDMFQRTDDQLAGEVAPCTVVIEPTDRCNLLCPGCYAKSSADGSDLPFEQLEQIVGQVVDMGVTLITLSGGEPFLRERTDQAITRLAKNFSDRGFLVYTNGTMIDDAIAARLGKCGNVFPAISVEGFEHQTDARRGKGIYEQNRKVRQRLRAAGVMAGFSATLTRDNADSIVGDEFLDLRIAEGDLFGWFFLLQPIGRAPRPDLMVTAEQRARLREAVYRWRVQRRPIFLGDFWNDGLLTGGCIAGGRYYFHIYANGEISPCVFSPVSCGNVFDIIHGRGDYATLRQFVREHPTFQAIRQAQARITDRHRPCLLIDNPELFRQVAGDGHCTHAKNMAPGYLDGEIARSIDAAAADWARLAPTLPDLPRPQDDLPAPGEPKEPVELPAAS